MTTIEEMRNRLSELMNESTQHQEALQSAETDEARNEAHEAIRSNAEEFSRVEAELASAQSVADMRAKSEILDQPAVRVEGEGPNARFVEDKADSLDTVTDEMFAPVSDETRAIRTELWQRHQAGESMSDADKVAMRQVFPEDRAFKLWIRHGTKTPAKAVEHLMERGDDGQKRAISGTSLTDNSDVVVPEVVANELIEVMKYTGPMLELCRIANTATGATFKYPKMDSTSVTAAYMDDGADATQADMEVSTVNLGSHSVRAPALPVARSTIQDSLFSVDDLVFRWVGGAFGRFVNSEVTKGSTSNRVSGLISGTNIPAAQEVTTAGSNSVVASDLLKLDANIDIAYRSLPSMALMMTDTTANAVRGEVVSNVGYVWQPDLRQGIASTFNGHRLFINPDMGEASVDNAIVAVLGAFEMMLIRLVQDMTIRRSEHIYIAQNCVGFFSDMRFDAKVLDSNAFAKLKAKA